MNKCVLVLVLLLLSTQSYLSSGQDSWITLDVREPPINVCPHHAIVAVYYEAAYPWLKIKIVTNDTPKLGLYGDFHIYLDLNETMGVIDPLFPLYGAEYCVDFNSQEIRWWNCYEWITIGYASLSWNVSENSITIALNTSLLKVKGEIRLAIASFHSPGDAELFKWEDRAPTAVVGPPYTDAYVIVDEEPPEIFRARDFELEYDTPFNLTVRVRDDLSGVRRVLLNLSMDLYTWETLEMIPAGKNIYVSEIPAAPYNTTVYYHIVAEDNAGNVAVWDKLGMMYKLKFTDLTPPVIQHVEVSEGKVRQGGDVQFKVSVYEPKNASGVKNVTLFYSYDGINFENKTMTPEGYDYVVILTNVSGDFVFYIVAFDNHGNRAESSWGAVKLYSPLDHALEMIYTNILPASAMVGILLLTLGLLYGWSYVIEASSRLSMALQGLVEGWLKQVGGNPLLLLIDICIVSVFLYGLMEAKVALVTSMVILMVSLLLLRGEASGLRKVGFERFSAVLIPISVLMILSYGFIEDLSILISGVALLLIGIFTPIYFRLVASIMDGEKAAFNMAVLILTVGFILQLYVLAMFILRAEPLGEHLAALILSSLYIIAGLTVMAFTSRMGR